MYKEFYCLFQIVFNFVYFTGKIDIQELFISKSKYVFV